jgi:hypothetical protein
MWGKKKSATQRKYSSSEAESTVGAIASEIGEEFRFEVDEARLGLFLLALAPGNGAASKLRPLFADWGEAEWRLLAEIADNEVMLSWIAHRLSLDSLGCAADVLAEMQAKSTLRRKWNRVIGLAAVDLCDRLNNAGVYTTILKGAPLSLVCYGEADLRDVRDIDLLVSPDNAFRAGEILSTAGYECEMDSTWLNNRTALKTMRQVSFRSLRGALEIDLHWKVANEWINSSVNEVDVANSARPLVIFNRNVKWLDERAALSFAASNVAGSHHVEMKACVDYLRLAGTSVDKSAQSMTEPHVTTPTLSAVRENGLHAPLSLLTSAARLSYRAVCYDLFVVGGPDTPSRSSIWGRNLTRVRTVSAFASLLQVAMSPTKSLYVRQRATKNNGTAMGATTLLRKFLR